MKREGKIENMVINVSLGHWVQQTTSRFILPVVPWKWRMGIPPKNSPSVSSGTEPAACWMTGLVEGNLRSEGVAFTSCNGRHWRSVWAAWCDMWLTIYQMLPNEGSDPREQQKVSRAQCTSLGVCRGISLFPRDPSITPARDCVATDVTGPSEVTLSEALWDVISLHFGLYPLLQFLLNNAYFSGFILGTRDTVINKIRQERFLLELPV